MKTVKEYISEAIVKSKLKQYNNNDGYVDLDLPSGLKWATCNIGASNPEESGLLFQWGRIDGYEYGDKNHGFLYEHKYNTNSREKYNKLEKEVLDKEDDAAYVHSKGKLRMPTKEEIEELIDNTNIEFTELNKINGCKFIDKKDKNKWIFIPVTGKFSAHDYKFIKDNKMGFIWSSYSNHNRYSKAYCMCFFNDTSFASEYNRATALTIRGVEK